MAPRSRSIDGSATFTIVTSRSNMKIAMQLASSVHHLHSTRFRDYTLVVFAEMPAQAFLSLDPLVRYHRYPYLEREPSPERAYCRQRQSGMKTTP